MQGDAPTSYLFKLSDTFQFFKAYTDTEVSIDSRRNLEETPKEENLMSPVYFMFFVMSQIGGLYTFLKLFFSIFVSHFSNHSLNHFIINQIHRYKKKNSMKLKNENLKRRRSKRNKNRKVIPGDNEDIQNQKSLVREKDPLIKQKKEHNRSGRTKSSFHMSDHKTEKHKSRKRHKTYDDEYDGGDSQSSDDDLTPTFYDGSDLLYSVF